MEYHTYLGVVGVPVDRNNHIVCNSQLQNQLHQGTLCQENRTSCHAANTESEKGIELGYSTWLGLDTELKNLSPNGYDLLFVSSPYHYLSPGTAFENKLISCIIFWYVQLDLSIHVLGEVPKVPHFDEVKQSPQMEILGGSTHDV